MATKDDLGKVFLAAENQFLRCLVLECGTFYLRAPSKMIWANIQDCGSNLKPSDFNAKTLAMFESRQSARII